MTRARVKVLPIVLDRRLDQVDPYRAKFTPKMRKAMCDKSVGAGIIGGMPLPPEAVIPQDGARLGSLPAFF